MKDNMLEVGDKVCQLRGDDIIVGIHTIDRITATQAISGDTRFKKELSKSFYGRELEARLIGDTVWNRSHYLLATPELLEKSRIALVERKNRMLVRDFKYSDLTNEQTATLADLLRSFTKPTEDANT